MKVIYISGKYRDKRGTYYVEQNIFSAKEYALFVWKNGAVALCPHLNTAFFDGAYGIQDRRWIEGDIELVNRCDAVWCIPGWSESIGAKAERDAAVMAGIPVLYNEREVLAFIQDGAEGLSKMRE